MLDLELERNARIAYQQQFINGQTGTINASPAIPENAIIVTEQLASGNYHVQAMVAGMASAGAGSAGAGIGPVVGVTNAPRGIGFAPGTAHTAIEGMNHGGGHAIRHLIKDGTIANTGSLASKINAFADIAKPILENPLKSFNGWVGADKARIFIGEVNGKKLAIFVATEGPFQGKVITSFFPNAKKLVDWGF